MAYDPSPTRERLEAERALVAGNLAAYRKQMERMERPPMSTLIPDAIERARAALDRIDQELAALPEPAARGALSGAQALADLRAKQAP
jgi:hypothetical protein